MISVAALAQLSFDGRAYRAYGYLLSAERGRLLAVPVAAADGWLADAVDGCPVPWDEVLAVLEADGGLLPTRWPALSVQAGHLLALAPLDGWLMVRIAALDALVFVHADGPRLAIARDLAERK